MEFFNCQGLSIYRSENVSTPKVRVLNVEFTLKLRIYRSLKSLICLKWIRKSFPQHCKLSSTTLHSRSLPLSLRTKCFVLTAGITIFLLACLFIRIYNFTKKNIFEKKHACRIASTKQSYRTCEQRHENVYWFLRIQNAIKDLVKLSIMSMKSR